MEALIKHNMGKRLNKLEQPHKSGKSIQSVHNSITTGARYSNQLTSRELTTKKCTSLRLKWPKILRLMIKGVNSFITIK